MTWLKKSNINPLFLSTVDRSRGYIRTLSILKSRKVFPLIIGPIMPSFRQNTLKMSQREEMKTSQPFCLGKHRFVPRKRSLCNIHIIVPTLIRWSSIVVWKLQVKILSIDQLVNPPSFLGSISSCPPLSLTLAISVTCVPESESAIFAFFFINSPASFQPEFLSSHIRARYHEQQYIKELKLLTYSSGIEDVLEILIQRGTVALSPKGFILQLWSDWKKTDYGEQMHKRSAPTAN